MTKKYSMETHELSETLLKKGFVLQGICCMNEPDEDTVLGSITVTDKNGTVVMWYMHDNLNELVPKKQVWYQALVKLTNGEKHLNGARFYTQRNCELKWEHSQMFIKAMRFDE